MSYIIIEESPVSKFLFSNTKMALFWLVVRLYVGWEWLSAGWDKIFNEAWVGSEAGKAISGFVQGALQKTGGAHPDVSGWYAVFLQNTVLPNVKIWSYVVAYGEFFVGVGLIVGCFVGVAAFFGLFMNLSYLLAGTLSTNPILFVLSVGLILAWKVAGYWGLDRYVLPKFGVPWRSGQVYKV
ncbi:MAG: DoxX family membrane protein [Minisyncoccota bacterium]